MKTLAIYALEVLACSGVLLAAYTILLDRRVKFRWCRLYLLASVPALVGAGFERYELQSFGHNLEFSARYGKFRTKSSPEEAMAWFLHAARYG